MLIRRCLIYTFLIISVKTVYSQRLNISLFHDNNIKTLVFSTVSGEYNMKGDGIVINRSAAGDIYLITLEKGRLSISDKVKSIGNYNKLEFTGTGSTNTFQLNPASPTLSSREYDDDLLLVSNQVNILIINKIDIEKYLPGVIETEGGSYAPLEFYKAQAILIRTYAIKNKLRHSSDGFNLCDGTHCQAYKGKSRLNSLIYKAAKETKGKVLADMYNNLIITPYHSNCGGITSNADEVWQKNLPYLVCVRDPFCTQGRNAAWNKRISVVDWKDYLRKNGIHTKNNRPDNFVFSQFIRKKFYKYKNQNILLTKIREDWNLKSSFFSIKADNNMLLLDGKGFGHGVGLCQEGAIEMAKVGYTYLDILHFYFKNVNLVDYNILNNL